MIATVWFCLVAIMIAGYVVLDGFDLAPASCIYSSPTPMLSGA